jgi:hypothetical protein
VLQFHTLNRSIHTHSINQVRKGIYSSGIGKWRKFAKQLEPIRQLLLPIMTRMMKNKELPFPNEINWLLDPDFAYEEQEVGAGGRSGSSKQRDERSDKFTATSIGDHGTKHRQTDRKDASVEKKPSPAKYIAQRYELEREWKALHGGEVAAQRSKMVKPEPRLAGKAVGKRGKIGKFRKKIHPAGHDFEGSPEDGTGEGPRRVPAGAGWRGRRATGKVKGKRRRRRGEGRVPGAGGQGDDSRGTKPKPKQEQREKKEQRAEKEVTYLMLVRMLEDLRASLGSQQVIVQALPAVLRALQFPTGDTTLDTLTAYGVCLFNTGNLKQAIEVLEPLVSYRKDMFSALTALASSYAIDGDLHKAFSKIDQVTQLMEEEELTFDICERRAQVCCLIDAMSFTCPN